MATNTGNVTLHNVSIVDPKLGTLACTPTQPATLAPAAALSCTGSHTVNLADLDAGSYYNIATADSTETLPVTDEVTVPMTQAPHIMLAKDATELNFDAAGDVLHYTLVATNNGNVTLHNVTISDPLLGSLICADPSQPAVLAPGDQLICEGSYTVLQRDVDAGKADNTASTRGTPPTGPAVTDTASESVPAVQTPALTVVKTAAPSTYAKAGDVIGYSYLVTNSGNVTLYGITVVDDKATVTCPSTRPDWCRWARSPARPAIPSSRPISRQASSPTRPTPRTARPSRNPTARR